MLLIPNKEMASLWSFLVVFLCIFFTYKLLQFIYELLELIYKILRVILQKISPLLMQNVQVPSLNIHSAPPYSSESSEYDSASAASFESIEYESALASSSESSKIDAASSSRSYEHDVFLSFRGEDTCLNFVDHLYWALERRQINTYKDDRTLDQGESIGPALKKAIKDSRIAVIVFSKNYANSSWCLNELEYIMECNDAGWLMVVPIFYDVEPSEVRRQEGDFGIEFATQASKNTTKAGSWIKSLVDVGNMSGWEPKKMANGHEAEAIEIIVDRIFHRLLPFDSDDVDGDLVGMNDRFQDLVSLLQMGLDDVRMVGIWGIGGSGKSTLATSFFMKISHHFQGHCIVSNVRERSRKEGLEKLQEQILSSLCKKKLNVQSHMVGKRMIKNMLRHRKVLILLDDVDAFRQLETLVGNRDWFGRGSRIIITTRDNHLLCKVDNVYHVRLLSEDEAIWLFNRYANNGYNNPMEDYEALSLLVVSYAGRLPLALKVLGLFLCDKTKEEWKDTLDKLRDNPEPGIVNKLRISYDGLEANLKKLFLDIACFFRFVNLDDAKDILKACGYYLVQLEVLTQKALITTSVRIDMHDMIQEMGHYIVRAGSHSENPKEYSRIWDVEDIIKMCLQDATMENTKTEAISCEYNLLSYKYSGSGFKLSRLCTIISNMKKLRLLRLKSYYDPRDTKFDLHEAMFHGPYFHGPIFHSNEFRYINWKGYPESSPFPDTFRPVNLVVLKLSYSYQEELWRDCKHLPHLKEFHLKCMWRLVKIPEFGEAVSLQKLIIDKCPDLKEIHPSLGNCTGLEYVQISNCIMLQIFPTFVHMINLKRLFINGCKLSDVKIPSGIDQLFNLRELNLSHNNFTRLDFSISQLIELKLLNLSFCRDLIHELPELPSGLAILIADYCESLEPIRDCYRSCEWLCQVSFWGDLGGKISGGVRLLESMLEGKAIKNGSMLLYLRGVEIPNAFSPPVVDGSTYRLKLPENWCNNFSGFLICLVVDEENMGPMGFRVSISVNKGLDLEDNLIWQESEKRQRTIVAYIPFGSLKDTSWWDPTYKSLFFYFELNQSSLILSGTGIRLVGNGVKETSETTDYSSLYTPTLQCEHDSALGLTISLDPYRMISLKSDDDDDD